MLALLVALACSTPDPGLTVEVDGEVVIDCTDVFLQRPEWGYAIGCPDGNEHVADIGLGDEPWFRLDAVNVDGKPHWSDSGGLLEGTWGGSTEDGRDVWAGWSVVL